MSNEQSGASSSGGQPSTSTSTFSFLSKGSVKKPKGMYRGCPERTKQESVQDDPDFKRLQEIPRFLPILRGSVGAGQRAATSEPQHKMSHRAMWKLTVRVQEHLHECAQLVVQEQGRVNQRVKNIDARLAGVAAKLLERKKRYERLEASVGHVKQLQDEVVKIQLLMEEIVPCVQTLTEFLNDRVPQPERLPPLDFSSILVRSAPPSTSSSVSSSAFPSPRRRLGFVEPVEEMKVIDKSEFH